MLAARGVSLGLGKINLSELNQLPVADRALLGKIHKLKKKAEETKPKLVVKKHVDKKTLWAACRAVVIGAFIIAFGLMMTVLGYFDRDLTTSSIYNMTTGDEMVIVDASLRYKLKSMQYIGPVLMGIGTFLLIIACVITLESRDRHAQIIQEESSGYNRAKRELMNSVTKSSLLPNEETDLVAEARNYNNNGNGGMAKGTWEERDVDRPRVEYDLPSDKTNGVIASPSDHCRDIQVEVHHEEPGPSGRLSQSLVQLEKSPNHRSQRHQAGVLLSTINLKRPRGPAPMAEFGSEMDMPFSSCSTLGLNKEDFTS